jgi:hypothetical protein
MARESQGLQIALIVFVIFTIAFGVAAVLFSKEYGKEKALRADAEAKAEEANGALSAAESENMRLKEIVGLAETATLDAVDLEFNNDMTTYAQNYNDANLSYRNVCAWLFGEVQRKNAALSDEKARVQDLKNEKAALEAAKDKQVAQANARADKAEQDLSNERTKFNQAQVQLVGLTKKREADIAQVRQTSLADAQKKDEQISTTTKENARLRDLVRVRNEQIDEMDPVVVYHPDGKVDYVSPSSDTVWINIGRADGLSRLTNFSVYAKDTTDIASAGKKGSIEVINVIGDHQAEARIIEHVNISDPIMPGDLIFTPLWKRGQRERFALTDGMDLNGDGRSNVDEVRNLIKGNGGEVDFYLDDEGKAYGQMTAGTRYLVLGKQPDENKTIERINARTAAIRQADEYGLRVISLEDMLNMMGYVRQNPVKRYGSAADQNDFRAEAPEGVPRISPGNVTDLFQKRNPPRPAVNSAY